MFKISIVLFALFLALFSTNVALASIDEEDISEMVKKLSEGKSFAEVEEIGIKNVQIFFFSTASRAGYIIDFKTKTCYFRLNQSVTTANCAKIKKGYPLIAPLITW